MLISEGQKSLPQYDCKPRTSPGDKSRQARSTLRPSVPKRSSSSFFIGDQSDGHSISSICTRIVNCLRHFQACGQRGESDAPSPPVRFYHNTSREDISWKERSSLLPTVPKSSSSSFLIGDQSEGHSFSS